MVESHSEQIRIADYPRRISDVFQLATITHAHTRFVALCSADIGTLAWHCVYRTLSAVRKHVGLLVHLYRNETARETSDRHLQIEDHSLVGIDDEICCDRLPIHM